ncbi:acetyl-CoA decarbonylase/synthase complex subunit gamma [Metallumcola ferriviriculae]|uniref:Acetyl-CoA decarbonylase/synthase complex subunit gamma n=1 Tax=Metallumcola ferriviriculae TaxID=3039180 RepID=A0AAU0UN15_9FIRM|nr:acetyl-CoA decarbonylase/synthase complex subunit gamma [Desulfitibacteraceae bacterium MK1]
MGLTGLEIYKQLPKKNCGECGPPTCLAFAMALANGKAQLDTCPYVSDEARANLESASAPPIALVKAGVGDNVVEMGDETELFRHDKKYYHETSVGFKVSDALSAADIEAKAKEIEDLTFERVGMQYKVQFVAVVNESGDAGKFKDAVAKVAANTAVTPMLVSEDAAAIEAALEVVGDKKPVICAATGDNYEKMVELAKGKECPLVVKAEGLEALAELVEKVVTAGHKQLILDSGQTQTSKTVADLVQMRRQAIKKKFRPFGYPSIVFTNEEDPLAEISQAITYVSKYAGVIILNTTKKAHVLPLLSWRQNLYTDPQVPIQVEQKLHEVGEVDENSPVYITTNFSLTYYSVQGEIESTKIPSYILSVDTDGTSVLTAYAAGKYEAEKIAEVMKKVGLDDKVKHRDLIIPGYVAVLKGKLEEASGWNVAVGPREASGIVAFAKSHFS